MYMIGGFRSFTSPHNSNHHFSQKGGSTQRARPESWLHPDLSSDFPPPIPAPTAHHRHPSRERTGRCLKCLSSMIPRASMAPDSAETLVGLGVITSFALVVSGSMPTATTRLERRNPGATGLAHPSREKTHPQTTTMRSQQRLWRRSAFRCTVNGSTLASSVPRARDVTRMLRY